MSMRLAVSESTVPHRLDAQRAPAVLVVDDIRREFGGVHAVDGVSFAVQPGTILGLIGPNGAGKSTLLGMVAGAVKPSGGRVLFGGKDITGMAPHAIARLGIARTFQMAAGFPRLTVLESLLVAAARPRGDSLWGALLGKRYWRDREEQLVLQARGLLARWDLAGIESQYAGDLSGGQKRLVEIMRAAMMEPLFLLLDEPTVGVNSTLVKVIEEYLLELRQTGLGMLLVEHELGVVERLCDSVVVMARGKAISTGSLSEVRQQAHVMEAYFAG
jgi:ABC-type branched-subunit amino acid transport system ATPase component